MGKYIDAEVLIERWDNMSVRGRTEFDQEIMVAPSIDIVRCKECRHWCCHNDVDYDQSKVTYYCEVHGISFEGDDYCSFGERKEGE